MKESFIAKLRRWWGEIKAHRNKRQYRSGYNYIQYHVDEFNMPPQFTYSMAKYQSGSWHFRRGAEQAAQDAMARHRQLYMEVAEELLKKKNEALGNGT